MSLNQSVFITAQDANNAAKAFDVLRLRWLQQEEVNTWFGGRTDSLEKYEHLSRFYDFAKTHIRSGEYADMTDRNGCAAIAVNNNGAIAILVDFTHGAKRYFVLWKDDNFQEKVDHLVKRRVGQLCELLEPSTAV